eukprot:TRINITY_DN21806_c0_g1_i1.p1 TRINITY_DN21806_c0_g1~~TRINITY_DN21806_c0_g1_i1.p1  ORF type:complete len:522 (-),score=86.10 TRINITY_DN21806_c0_g1_i1:53-1576(-)
MDERLLQEQEGGDGTQSQGQSRHWRKAKHGVMTMVKVKQMGIRWARDTKTLRAMKTESEKKWYIFKIIVAITVLGVSMTMTKSALFHMTAVGRWDDGHAYKFSYALTLTMTVFVLKVLIAPIERCLKPQKGFVPEPLNEAEGDMPEPTLYQQVTPWLLLITFTTLEMGMATLSSLGLLYGAPTSIFIVFKASKAVFMALLSVVLLGRKLNLAQWASLGVISLALLLATVAEGKGGGKKGNHELNLFGPFLLLLSELCHAGMLIFQEIAVKQYWPNALELLSWSATFGMAMTGMAMYKSMSIWVELPDGGHRPFDDPVDVVYMCSTNFVLGFTLLLNISSHLSSDIAHIVILKHISALARSLCDALKLILMWILGKFFYFTAILPVLAEAWHPGLFGSWLMIPAIFAVVWGMLMFKNGVFVPVKYVKCNDGVWRVQEFEVERDALVDAEEEEAVCLDDPFFMEAFRSKKLKRAAQRAFHKVQLQRALKGGTGKSLVERIRTSPNLGGT